MNVEESENERFKVTDTTTSEKSHGYTDHKIAGYQIIVNFSHREVNISHCSTNRISYPEALYLMANLSKTA